MEGGLESLLARILGRSLIGSWNLGCFLGLLFLG